MKIKEEIPRTPKASRRDFFFVVYIYMMYTTYFLLLIILIHHFLRFRAGERIFLLPFKHTPSAHSGAGCHQSAGTALLRPPRVLRIPVVSVISALSGRKKAAVPEPHERQLDGGREEGRGIPFPAPAILSDF